MIPVDQTLFAGVRDPAKPETVGNCMQAAVASLLELELEDVPHFAAAGAAEWWSEMTGWITSKGFSLVVTQETLTHALGIMSGRSPRGTWDHVVVARGAELVHDPHPSRDGVIDPYEWWYLVPHDPTARLRDLVRGVFEHASGTAS